MSASALSELRSGVPSPDANDAPAAVGLARYRPLFLLGHGGMGSVEAVAEERPGEPTRVVALKRILRSATGADAARLEMFLREARLTTLLNHPNVIRSFAYGEADGEVFLAMEYVAGEPLSRLLAAAGERGAPLPLSVIAFILAEACEGLHAAHELVGADGEPLGVVHRDVSPQNVMVGYDGSVKLLDFGVAKIDLADCAARTKTGEVKGKTAYMSPEQAMGDEVDRRSDLYSMGAVLFECVAGRRMWGNGTDFDVLRKLALEESPKLEGVADHVPADLAALQARLVSRDRTMRPASAHDVALALRPFSGDGSEEVRATMALLFAGERERREAAMDRALAAPARERGATPLPELRTAGAQESGPVFVTHQNLATEVRTAGPSRIRTPVVGLLLLVASVASVVVLQSGRGAGANARKTSELERREAIQPAVVASGALAPTAPSNDPPASTGHPGSTTSASPSTARTPLAPRSLAIIPLVPRTLAAPRLSPPSSTSAPSVTAAAAVPAAPSATASAKPAPPPPDVDPTPF